MTKNIKEPIESMYPVLNWFRVGANQSLKILTDYT